MRTVYTRQDAALEQVPGHTAGADVGGTFTDLILRAPDGRLSVRKLLSTRPRYEEAVVSGLEGLLATGEDASSVDLRLSEVIHGTTVATNALFERTGARAALITTAGFRDVLELRRVRMPRMYDLSWVKPPPIIERQFRYEVHERMAADGEVLRALEESEVRSLAATLRSAQVEAVAVCLLHAHRYPAHEQRVGDVLREELPGIVVTLSSEILREQQEYERSAATAVNAYVAPIMSAYLGRLGDGLRRLGADSRVSVMQSSGGVMPSEDASARPVFCLESGPAAGVVAARALARLLEKPNVIAFDMGGTTAKASLIEGGALLRVREFEVGGLLTGESRLLKGSGELLRVPSIDIAEVGAGGGSVAWLDPVGALRVGPRSAGADPGPACYGRGGSEPTVTDANVVLGLIPSGPLGDGELSISYERAHEAITSVARPLGISASMAARAIHELANATMMRALRAVSSERGRDPADYALIAYGGSGPIHAAALAEELGITTVIVPPLAGLFSAVGLLYARAEYHDVRFIEMDAREPDLSVLERNEQEMQDSLRRFLNHSEHGTEWIRSADVRYRGQSWDIEVPIPGPLTERSLRELVSQFEAEHERLYGVRPESGSPVEIRALRLALLGPPRDMKIMGDASDRPQRATGATRSVQFGGDDSLQTSIWTRQSLHGRTAMAGPALIDEWDTTVVVPPGWQVQHHESGATLLTPVSGGARPQSSTARLAVADQIAANALGTIADEMATTIFRTAHSTIVRDAMDFSAAICTPNGETAAQALTIPFHLGSIPTAIRSLRDRYSEQLAPGDIFIMNDPFDGGIHTSDIYVAKPVFADTQLLGFAVTVAHHADVGGRVPGTTASDNTEIFQEGLRLPWTRLYAQNKPVEEIKRIIAANVRLPRMTFGDLAAQVAACTVAERGLVQLADRYGPQQLTEIMSRLLDHSEALVRAAVAEWPDGTAVFTDYIDTDGLEVRNVPVTVRLTVAGDEVEADFTESADMVPGALNATRSYTEASAYHAIIAAIDFDIPHTSGAFRPIRIVTRPGSVTHLVLPGACSMRGVTGFRVFDAVNGALAKLLPHRVPAAGEGGNTLAIFSAQRADHGRFIYYELVVGTWGGRATGDGNDGLSNPGATAANIPVEVAESEYPIRIERYGLVPDSGGAGEYRGGLAVERAWRVLTPETSLQVRSDRQINRPWGLQGGLPGSPSANVLSHNGDPGTAHPPMFSAVVGEGDLYSHRMAGGGGWGDPLDRTLEAVAKDVANGKVSVDAARVQYGVVIGRDAVLDIEATAALRGSRRQARAESVDL